MRHTVAALIQSLPGPVTAKWPQGERFVRALAHGSMSVELYAPEGHDTQTPHEQDELYFVVSGCGEFVLGAERLQFESGSVLFVPAGMVHRFENFTAGLITWVVFWGPKGGEDAA